MLDYGSNFVIQVRSNPSCGDGEPKTGMSALTVCRTRSGIQVSAEPGTIKFGFTRGEVGLHVKVSLDYRAGIRQLINPTLTTEVTHRCPDPSGEPPAN